jgi:hypothetical protein
MSSNAFQRSARTAAALASLLAVTSCAPKTSAPPSYPQAPAAPAPQGAESQPEIVSDPSFRQTRGQLLPETPEFPAYPGAALVGSAENNRPKAPNRGYTIKWTTKDSVPMVMAWYRKTLEDLGWEFTPPTDGVAISQIANIRKGNLQGTVEAEAEKRGHTEIEVVLKPRQ